MHFKAVSVKERLPEKGTFVTTIDKANEHRVYQLTDHGWNMRDADGMNSPNNNLPITHWLEEVDLSEQLSKARKWEALGEKISKCYVDEDGEELSDEAAEGNDLVKIGEIAASDFGWL